MDKPKIVFAGVDAGAKVFVELKGRQVVAALATTRMQNNDARTLIAHRVVELCRCRILHPKRAASGPIWFGGLKIGEHRCRG